MAKIQVNPDELEAAARRLAELAERLRSLSAQVEADISGSTAYDGQFWPKVRSLAAEARSSISTIGSRALEQSTRLQERAEAFRAAEDESVTAVGQLSTRFADWLNTASSSLAGFLQQRSDEFASFLHAASRTFEGSFVRIGQREDEGSTPRWLPLVLAAADAWAEFDRAIGEPVRRFVNRDEIEAAHEYQRYLELIGTYGYCPAPLTDPNANENRIVSGQMRFAEPPYGNLPGLPDDPSAPPIGHWSVLIMKGIEFFNAVLIDPANADYLAAVEPNVNFDLHFSNYDEGFRVPGMKVVNDSGVPIVIAGVQVDEWEELPTGIRIPRERYDIPIEQVIQPGEFSFIEFGHPREQFPQHTGADLYVLAASLSDTPQWDRMGWRVWPTGVATNLPHGWYEGMP